VISFDRFWVVGQRTYRWHKKFPTTACCGCSDISGARRPARWRPAAGWYQCPSDGAGVYRSIRISLYIPS